jgi:hypothetical protein
MRSDDFLTVIYDVAAIGGGCIAIIIGVALFNIVVHIISAGVL